MSLESLTEPSKLKSHPPLIFLTQFTRNDAFGLATAYLQIIGGIILLLLFALLGDLLIEVMPFTFPASVGFFLHSPLPPRLGFGWHSCHIFFFFFSLSTKWHRHILKPVIAFVLDIVALSRLKCEKLTRQCCVFLIGCLYDTLIRHLTRLSQIFTKPRLSLDLLLLESSK